MYDCVRFPTDERNNFYKGKKWTNVEHEHRTSKQEASLSLFPL